MIGKRGLFCIAWFVVFSASAGVQVESSVYPKQVHPQDEFTFTLRIDYDSEGEGGRIRSPRLPSLEHFYLTGQRESHSVSINNGNAKRQKKYHYTLRPKVEGRFTINPVEVVVGGKLYRTLPVEVEVSSRFKRHKKKFSQNPGNFSSPFGFPNIFQQFFGLDQGMDSGGLNSTLKKKDILFGLEVSKRKIYLGELIVARWIVYQREGLMGTIVSALMDRPEMDGFWVEPLVQPSGKLVDLGKSQVIGGVNYRKYLLDGYAISPLRTGELKIGKVKAELQLAGGGGGGLSFFQSGFQTLQKLSKEVRLVVSNLPKKGRKPFWTGAIGDWSLSAQVNKKVLSVNDSFIYRIIFKGVGQTRLIQLPSLDFGSSLELYDQVESQKFSLTNSQKKYELVIIPRQVGEIVIPKFELQTFDPDLGIYKTHTLPAFSLKAKKQLFSSQNREENQDKDQRYFRSSGADSIKKEDGKEGLSPWLLEDLESKWWSASNRRIFWGIVFSILGLWFFWVFLWRSRELFIRKKKGLEKTLEEFQKRIDRVVINEDWKMAGAILLDLIYLCLSEQGVSGSGKVRNLDLLLQGLPPHLKKGYEAQIRETVTTLEQLSFAPHTPAHQLRNKSNVLQLKRQVFAILRKVSV